MLSTGAIALIDNISIFDYLNENIDVENSSKQKDSKSDIDPESEINTDQEVTITRRKYVSADCTAKMKLSQYNLKMLDFAKDVFLKYLQMSNIPDDLFVEIIPVTMNLTQKCWEIFVDFVSSHNCIAMRRRATKEEKTLCNGKRDRYVISVRKNTTSSSNSSDSAEDLSSISSLSGVSRQSIQEANSTSMNIFNSDNRQSENKRFSTSLDNRQSENNRFSTSLEKKESKIPVRKTLSMPVSEYSDGNLTKTVDASEERLYQNNAAKVSSFNEIFNRRKDYTSNENISENNNCSHTSLQDNDSISSSREFMDSPHCNNNRIVDNTWIKLRENNNPDSPIKSDSLPHSQVSHVPEAPLCISEIYYKRKFDELVNALSKVIDADNLKSSNGNSETSTSPLENQDSFTSDSIKHTQKKWRSNNIIQSADLAACDVENSCYRPSYESIEASRDNLYFRSDMNRSKRPNAAILPSNQLSLNNSAYNLQNETNQMLVPVVYYNNPKITLSAFSPRTLTGIVDVAAIPSNELNSTIELNSQYYSMLIQNNYASRCGLEVTAFQQPSQHRSNLFQQVFVPTSALNCGIEPFLSTYFK